MNREGVVYTIVTTFLISFSFVAMLSLVNESTRERVQKNQVLAERRAVLNAFGIQIEGTEADYELYNARITERREGNSIGYATRINGQPLEAIRFSGSGLWGTITGIVAVREDFSRIAGFDIISHNETPGLGGRIDEAWFKDQFKNESLVDGHIRIRGGGQGGGQGDQDSENGAVDAITGATRTSQALERILNTYLEILHELIDES